MGQIFGIFAKSKGELITKSPLKAEEESFYSLANIFKDSNSYIKRILTESRIDLERKDWLILSADEEVSLKFNNIQDFADEEIDYKKSINQELDKDFHAIGMAYNAEIGEIVYTEKYKALENWSKIDIVFTALYKIKEVLFEDLKITIESKKDSDYLKYSYDNIQILLGIVSTLKKVKNADEVAIIYGPY